MPENAVLERMLADADPARTARDAKPDAAALMTRDRIIRRGAASRRRAPVVVGWASGLATAVAAVVVAFAVMIPHGVAVAGTPRPLDFADGGSVTQILDAAQADLAGDPGPAEPLRTVRSAVWAFTFGVDDERTEIVPQLTTLHWEPDLSGRMTIVAGEPYDPADAAANADAEVTSTGEVTTDLLIKAGQFNTPVAEPPGSSREDVRAALTAFGLPADPSSSEVVAAATSLLEQWTLTNEQESQLLAILAETGDAQALGTTTDRLGRPVAGLRMQSADGAAADVLLISRDTGRIVGVERTALLSEDPIPAGAVISYRMWDVEGLIE
ncbi:hypothetical protein [Microbacterium hydrocarbonoxydans]|uniref:hypothetical protein n=1 Tax=Microbacterium hydrocarbonoxydans TaxID=273678 RepID=UPI0007BB0298|nr:hypothetical protein [Microbacterium hydrocarbonoxydans]GAT73363.1 pyruvate/2-oxoglutarate dehydrogenase complex [Microbacterium sp. HM58-2]